MQPIPTLLRHSFRSSLNLTRAHRPVRTPLLPVPGPKPLPHRKDVRRNFSVCLQCQFRAQPNSLRSDETGRTHDLKSENRNKDGEPAIPMPPPEGIQNLEMNVGSQSPRSAPATEAPTRKPEQSRKDETNTNEGTETSNGGLPSYIENRRSQFSKQFTEMMDNIQSNVFVAGQRLNDLTGYSSIEALKKAILDQEEKLRAARLQVRTAKDAYAAAINRRSASQREVNELLQRKHAWSPADLERFTHLYRNDHTNEVAENEAQEALSAAEREAEESAAQLTKNILSRYHEEQVWSDKIRRMSTWGTWGLMGVNVLLFLIFQIGVEPWRRKRLVKGFEEKVIEAIEKEKATNQAQLLAAVGGISPPAAQETIASSPATSETSSSVEESATNETVADVTVAPTTPMATTSENVVTQDLDAGNNAMEPSIPPPLQFPPSATGTSWREYLHGMLSDRSVVLTQRDLSTVVITSATAGAALMSLFITLIRQQ